MYHPVSIISLRINYRNPKIMDYFPRQIYYHSLFFPYIFLLVSWRDFTKTRKTTTKLSLLRYYLLSIWILWEGLASGICFRPCMDLCAKRYGSLGPKEQVAHNSCTSTATRSVGYPKNTTLV